MLAGLNPDGGQIFAAFRSPSECRNFVAVFAGAEGKLLRTHFGRCNFINKLVGMIQMKRWSPGQPKGVGRDFESIGDQVFLLFTGSGLLPDLVVGAERGLTRGGETGAFELKLPGLAFRQSFHFEVPPAIPTTVLMLDGSEAENFVHGVIVQDVHIAAREVERDFWCRWILQFCG